MPAAAEFIPAQIIYEHNDNVWPPRNFVAAGIGKQSRKHQQHCDTDVTFHEIALPVWVRSDLNDGSDSGIIISPSVS